MQKVIQILSIDDSRAVHAFLDRSLQGTPHKIHHAMGGSEGLAQLRDVHKKIDLILLDWEMPEKNGPDVLVDIRSAGFMQPVVMLTSKNSEADITQMLNAGVTEYIMKPFTPEILIEKLEMVANQVQS